MRLITQRTVEQYASSHPELAHALSDWCAMVHAARWTSGDEVTRSSSFTVRALPNKRLIFNIHHNAHRLVCSVQYADPLRGYNGIVRVEFIGTHAEYDHIDAKTVRRTP